MSSSTRFSALQRAENSSMHLFKRRNALPTGFQCSSASRKFLNGTCAGVRRLGVCSFSALQRAENSSICVQPGTGRTNNVFQCSSASRKFLNKTDVFESYSVARSFSALQRAENSSILVKNSFSRSVASVSVLFSEPKIPQSRPSHLRPSIFPTAMITLRHS